MLTGAARTMDGDDGRINDATARSMMPSPRHHIAALADDGDSDARRRRHLAPAPIFSADRRRRRRTQYGHAAAATPPEMLPAACSRRRQDGIFAAITSRAIAARPLSLLLDFGQQEAGTQVELASHSVG